MDELLKLGEKYNIKIIEDSAEAVGSIYKGRKAGSMGVFSTFSFHGTKTMTTGEGGMFVTNDRSVFEKALTLSNHGRKSTQSKQFWSDECGFKFKMSNIQAALGCAQLSRIEELVQRKIEIMSTYKTLLGDLKHISLNHESQETINGSWMPNAVFSKDSGVTRDILLKTFQDKNIDARVFFWPLSSLPMFTSKNKNTNSYSIAERSINLPSFHDITTETINQVANVLKEIESKTKI